MNECTNWCVGSTEDQNQVNMALMHTQCDSDVERQTGASKSSRIKKEEEKKISLSESKKKKNEHWT